MSGVAKRLQLIDERTKTGKKRGMYKNRGFNTKRTESSVELKCDINEDEVPQHGFLFVEDGGILTDNLLDIYHF